jgi:hypothetical protein
MSARDAAQLGRQRARLCNRVGSCFFADEFPRGCSPGLCSAWCGALNCMCQDWGAFRGLRYVRDDKISNLQFSMNW